MKLKKNSNDLSTHKNIISRVAKGNKKAFAELYELFCVRVYNTALSYLKNEHYAEEITQEVFVTLFRNASKFRGDAKVSTWIYRITVNTSLNYIKRKKRFSLFNSEHSWDDMVDFDHPGVLMEKKEEARILFKVIDILPKNQKTAFILSFVEELPRQEVADIMGLSLKAVESLLQRAKKKLRAELTKLYPRRRKNQSRYSNQYKKPNQYN